jgi:hypothetical protein
MVMAHTPQSYDAKAHAHRDGHAGLAWESTTVAPSLALASAERSAAMSSALMALKIMAEGVAIGVAQLSPAQNKLHSCSDAPCATSSRCSCLPALRLAGQQGPPPRRTASTLEPGFCSAIRLAFTAAVL